MINSMGAIDGAIIGAICGLLVSPFFYFRAKRQQRLGKSVGTPMKAQLAWNGSYAEAFQRSQYILSLLKAKVIDANPNKGVILAGTGANLLSMGGTVHVRFYSQGAITQVHIECASSASWKDSGDLSKKFVEKFVATWNSLPGPVQFNNPGGFHI
jgi:hypothetical protein